jgi:hypothetical protein
MQAQFGGKVSRRRRVVQYPAGGVPPGLKAVANQTASMIRPKLTP